MVLYHASQIKNLKVIKPQRTLSNNQYIGDYVFATTNHKLAVMYLVPKGISTLMNPDGENSNIVICDESEFMKRDRGGAVYELSTKHFAKTPQKGLSEYEMVSKSEAIPINKNVYASALDALISLGIKIRFTDEKTFESLISNPNQKNIIESLELYQPK